MQGMITEGALVNYFSKLALTSGAVGDELSDTSTYPYLIRTIIPKKYYCKIVAESTYKIHVLISEILAQIESRSRRAATHLIYWVMMRKDKIQKENMRTDESGKIIKKY